MANRTSKSERLLAALSPYDRFVIVLHDNPDPDAIAAGWGLRVLLRKSLGKPARIVGGGAIVRAENQHMVELLAPPIELVDDIDLAPSTASILVDCSPGSTNHMLMRKGIDPDAVIDHHIEGESRGSNLAFRDVRPNAVASVTIVASYLREQGIEPNKKLATAMVYAMRTEASGNAARHSRLDRSILSWLTGRAEPALIAAIENAPLSRAYFGDLVLAIQSALLHGDVAWCFLPRASGAEIVGEVADLLIRCDGVRHVLCAAVIGDDVLVSSRTASDGGNAAALLRRALDGIGVGGGHAHRAGGKVEQARQRPERLEQDLRRRWLRACGAAKRRGVRLIAKREIMDNL